jgi:D-glycero-D-manno-heptose 1,7-bisphosphate phosphatase
MNHWNIDSSWCLFLDRDGVINTRKMGGYIQTIEEFEFLPDADHAIAAMSQLFKHVFVVTNQQGIGKGIMTESNLSGIHRYMSNRIIELGGSITKCYHAPDLDGENNLLRKPNIGMGLLAQNDFPEVDFEKSIMVGDSDTDIEFGTKLGMKTVRILTTEKVNRQADMSFTSLAEFYDWIKQH